MGRYGRGRAGAGDPGEHWRIACWRIVARRLELATLVFGINFPTMHAAKWEMCAYFHRTCIFRKTYIVNNQIKKNYEIVCKIYYC